MNESFEISKEYEGSLDLSTRKERGIYYTPYIIVEYILSNTLNKHDIIKEPFPRVLDLSCGCGNFLINAYDILYEKIYSNFDELKFKYSDVFKSREDISTYIIKNCIFGIDIDKDALEILKLQLKNRARTAYKKILLDKDELLDGDEYLNYKIIDIEVEKGFNIVCGDSLKVDLKEAFNVDRFDYIVGNPPYIGQKLLDNEYKKFLYREYKDVYKNKGDLYFCFYKRFIDLLSSNGKAGIITPRYFMQSPSGKDLRDYIMKNCEINKMVDFLGAKIFKGLGIASCINLFTKKSEDIIFEADKDIISYKSKNKISNDLSLENSALIDLYKIINENIDIKNITSLESYLNGDNFKHIKLNKKFLGESWMMVEEEEFEFFNKIQSKSQYTLEDICESFQGIITGCDKAFVVNANSEHLDKIDEDLLKNWIKNKNVDKYIIDNIEYKLIYSNDIKDEKDYPYIIDNILSLYKKKLSDRRECVRKSRKWYELQWGRDKGLFEQKKIMYPYKSRYNRFAIDNQGCYASADVYSFYIKDEYKEEFSYEYLVGLLNSRVYNRYFKIIGKEMGKKIFDYYPNKVMKLKIFKDDNYLEIENLSKQLISLCRRKTDIINQMYIYFELSKTSKKDKKYIDDINTETFLKDCGQNFKKKNYVKIQDKKISLLKEKDYLERKIDFLENRIEEIINTSLSLQSNLDF